MSDGPDDAHIVVPHVLPRRPASSQMQKAVASRNYARKTSCIVSVRSWPYRQIASLKSRPANLKKPAHETTCGNRSNVNGCVADIYLGPLDSFITRRIFRRLVRSAYTESELRSFLSETGFQSASIRADGIGFKV